ncbi:MAG TPA: hypothetical protein VHH13_12615 [Arthrobacter sp.]|nr:hypothetical protein [Arthrobacter sp.]
MTDHAVTTSDGVSEAVAGPFTVRDVAVALSVVLLFLASVLPTAVIQGIGLNQWNSANLFRLGLSILLPAMVLVLFIIRRLAPKTKLRIGSLSVDQFASVVASFTTGYFFLTLVSAFSVSAAIGFIGSLGLLAATVCARWIPQFRADFAGRLETPAHPIARDAVPARAKAPKPVAEEATPAGSPSTGTNSTGFGAKGAAAGAAGTGSGATAGLSGPGAHGALATASTAAAGAAGKDKGGRDEGRFGASPEDRSNEATGRPAASGEAARTGAIPRGSTGAAAPSRSAAEFAAPAGTGAAGVAGVTAAAEAGKADAKKATPSARHNEAAGDDDLTAPGAADGEAVGIPMSDDEVTAAADAKRSATESSAAASSRAAQDAALPQDRGEVTEADSIAGAGSRGPNADKEQPDAGAAAAGGSTGEKTSASQTAPAAQTVETGRSEDRTKDRDEDRSGAEMPKTTAMGSVAGASTEGARRDAAEPISATREHIEEPDEDVTYEAFWFAVGRTRPTYDENTGDVAFMLEPGAWILALQDRGDEFLVQHTDGRVGVLRDLTNIERA